MRPDSASRLDRPSTVPRSREAGPRPRRDGVVSARRAQTVQHDRHEPTDRRLRTLRPRAGEGVDVATRELVSRYVLPDVAGPRGSREQVSDHLVDLSLYSPDPLVSMQELSESGVLVAAGMTREERVGLEHRLERS
jgi:hypothetical protein